MTEKVSTAGAKGGESSTTRGMGGGTSYRSGNVDDDDRVKPSDFDEDAMRRFFDNLPGEPLLIVPSFSTDPKVRDAKERVDPLNPIYSDPYPGVRPGRNPVGPPDPDPSVPQRRPVWSPFGRPFPTSPIPADDGPVKPPADPPRPGRPAPPPYRPGQGPGKPGRPNRPKPPEGPMGPPGGLKNPGG